MSTFWSRTKRRAVAALAAGAAGAAAAYCVYTWYSTSPDPSLRPQEDAEIDKGQPSTSGSGGGSSRSGAPPPPPVLLDPTGSSSGTAQMDAEAHLQHHFQSIQEIAEATTLPSLLPALGRALAAADDVDASLERLRLARVGEIAIHPDEKRALWQELSIDALARVVATCWMLPLLCLQVRVQLNILGRHLYLETALVEPGVGGINRPMRLLSSPSQEAFLANSEHLAKSGHALLLAEARKAAATALHDMSLTQELDAATLSQLLSDAMTAFVTSAVNIGWPVFLLPTPTELRESLRLRRPDDRAMLPGGDKHLVDTDAVEGMVGEVGGILASQRFHDVALTCTQAVTEKVAVQLTAQLQGGSQPLARVVPLLVAEAKRVLSPQGECVVAVAGMPEVESLCATVYSCGPPF